ncbi:uncharacterized protein LOC105833788 [Monomorium pharaonis]|uniref:uncharacterized protein LOC105833788 n=1 Tax=Monomorium pharaonis TaxID=307658 RepID=UPI0017478845|nr:uncharacterized protein LOC105833788 [Monomorium pharaonis]
MWSRRPIHLPDLPTNLSVAEVYCDTLPTKVARSEDTVLPERNNSHAIEKESFWKNLNLSRHKPTKVEELRNLSSTNSKADNRKGRFLSSLAFLTGLSFGGLATAASSTVKSIAKMPQAFSINLGSSKSSPYFAAYYSQYPYAPLLPYPFFYPGALALASTSDAAKPQTPQGDLIPQVISLFDNRSIDLVENNEDYTDPERFNAGNGADDRKRLRTEANRNAEEKGTIGKCKEFQRKHSNALKETAREREYLQTNAADFQTILNFRVANQTVLDNATTIAPENRTHHHHHHHHHHHGQYGQYGHPHKEHPHFSGYYGGYPQNIHHVELTTSQPYSQVSYNVPPYEQPANFYPDDKYNAYPSINHPNNPVKLGEGIPDYERKALK